MPYASASTAKTGFTRTTAKTDRSDQSDLDQLYSRVFATPDGKRVLELIAEGSPEGWALAVDVETRLQRARKRWATKAPD